MSDSPIPVHEPEAPRVKRAYGPRRTTGRAKITRTARARTADDAAQAGVALPPEYPTQAPIRDEQGANLTRQSRAQRDVSGFDFPLHRRKPGWDYQMMAVTVMGQPVSGGELAPFYQQGWRPVPSSEAPELQVPGFHSDTIDVRGMRWFWRPEHLSQQAKMEDHAAAVQQQKDRMFGAARGEVRGEQGLSDIPGVRPVNLGVEVYGETGTMDRRRG